MNLKSLIHRELGEGLTKAQLASAVGVPVRTITNILADQLPHDHLIWGRFAQYFRVDIEFLRTGEVPHTSTMGERSGSSHQSAAGHMRRLPFLTWPRIKQMVTRKSLPPHIDSDTMIETTDIAGSRTFAAKVQDDAMAPLLTKGEMIFVNPDLPWKPGDYALITRPDGNPETLLLRQIKPVGNRYMLHPLNRKYTDLLLRPTDKVLGKIVRLRKSF